MQNLQPHADRWTRWLGVVLALGYFGLCVLMTKHMPVSWNDIARVAAIESLSERGTWAIDDSPWLELTQDKVFHNGKFYSDKLPLLSWAASGVYSVGRQFLNLSLAPDCAEQGATCAYYFLTLVLIGLPASVLVVLVFDYVRQQRLSLWVAVLATIALALGTMILPYSLVLNHHLPAAVSLFAAFYLLVTRPKQDKKWIAGVGFFSALALTLDPLSGIFTVALFVLAALRFRFYSGWFLLGALPPLLVTALLDWQMAGTITPLYMIPGGYDYPGSVFPATVGGNGTPDDLPQYAFKMFLGAQGLFAYNPVLIFALVGMVIVALKRDHPLRKEALVLGAASVALGIYLATRTGNLGGVAYGERWFVHAVPLVMAFLIFVPPLTVQSKPIWRWVTLPLFGIALAASLFSSYQGALAPWNYVPPPAHISRDPATGAIGWRWRVNFP